MSKKGITRLIVGLSTALLLLIIIGKTVSISNEEVDIRNTFTSALNERTAIYDNEVFKTISQKAQVALKNDSSFKEVVNAQISGQKDAPGLFMKWVQQSNPAATFTAVSDLYKDLSRAIEAVRLRFVEVERKLAEIKRQHDNIRTKWPGNWVVGNRKELAYKPITSDRTDQVMKTGKDNNVNVF